MMKEQSEMIGFACAYTPLALIDAAGYVPYRILPTGDWPDQAGHLLHDNLCPHIKRILDRALDKDVPELAGMVFINSCDAMRRLADAWRRIRPHERITLVDLPVMADELSISFFANELSGLTNILSEWSGRSVSKDAIGESIARYNELASLLEALRGRVSRGALKGGSAQMQDLYNRAATEPIEQTLRLMKKFLAEPELRSPVSSGVPIYLFGNVLPDLEAFSLLESCGARIAGEDLCTGSRLFSLTEVGGDQEVLVGLARSLLSRPPCARTLDPLQPGKIGEDILAKAKDCDAHGVIGHTIKFCDPYLDRLPRVREALREGKVPLLLLEGDCTMRSMGQQRTRIEAFIEMLR